MQFNIETLKHKMQTNYSQAPAFRLQPLRGAKCTRIDNLLCGCSADTWWNVGHEFENFLVFLLLRSALTERLKQHYKSRRTAGSRPITVGYYPTAVGYRRQIFCSTGSLMPSSLFWSYRLWAHSVHFVSVGAFCLQPWSCRRQRPMQSHRRQVGVLVPTFMASSGLPGHTWARARQ